MCDLLCLGAFKAVDKFAVLATSIIAVTDRSPIRIAASEADYELLIVLLEIGKFSLCGISLRGEADVLRLQRTNRFLKAVEFLLILLKSLDFVAPSFDLLLQFCNLLVALTKHMLTHQAHMLCPCIVLAQFSDESLAIADGLGKRFDHGATDVGDVGDVAHCVFALRCVSLLV